MVQSTKTFSLAIIIISLFPSASISATKQAKQPTRSTIIEKRIYDGDLPSSQDNPSASPTAESSTELNFCKTKSNSGQNPKIGAQRIDLQALASA